QVRAWHPNHRLMLPVRARTLTSFGFALTLRPDVKRFKFSVRFFVRTPFCECPVRARSFERGPSLRSGPGLTFLTWLNASSPGTIFCECPPPRSFAALYGAVAVAQQVLGSRRRRRALGRARGRARPNPAGCGEVTSPLFSITSILNATSYQRFKDPDGQKRRGPAITGLPAYATGAARRRSIPGFRIASRNAPRGCGEPRAARILQAPHRCAGAPGGGSGLRSEIARYELRRVYRPAPGSHKAAPDRKELYSSISVPSARRRQRFAGVEAGGPRLHSLVVDNAPGI